MDVSIVLTNFNFNKILDFQICAVTIFNFKFYGKLLSSIKISFDIVCKGYIFGHSNGIQATKSIL